MKANPLLIGGCVLVTLLCVFSTFRSCTRSERPDKFYDYVGTRAGEAVAEVMPAGGTALLLVRPDTEGMFGVMTDACAAALEKNGATVVRQAIREVELDDMASETSVSADLFKEAMAAAPDGGSVAMVVSFIGVPPGSARKGEVPVYVVAASEAECRSALKRKRIVGALAMKPWDSLSGQAISTEPAKRFEQTCTVLP